MVVKTEINLNNVPAPSGMVHMASLGVDLCRCKPLGSVLSKGDAAAMVVSVGHEDQLHC